VGENLHPTVMKFGGTSVGDVAAFERVFHIVSTQIEKHPVVVVSAMTRVTDALLNAFDIAKKGDHFIVDKSKKYRKDLQQWNENQSFVNMA